MDVKRYLKKLVILGLVIGSHSSLAQYFDLSNSSFKDLYNRFRVAQPTNIPWAGSYFAYKRDGIATPNIQGQQGQSPAQKYDSFFNQGNNAYNWEKENHSCSKYQGETKKSCDAWWGHCNAWAAAAIKEPEPRKAINFTQNGKTGKFTVADQKAFLTEIYMATHSLFAGNTDKGTKTDKNWVFNPSHPSYQKFWDVSPRTFFLIFTNYVGARKTGVVVDRFTGDQVWNQPIVGYRFLPIRGQDIHSPENQGGRTVYPVTIRTKLYWAEDGVAEYEISKGFSINNTNDNEAVEDLGHHYTGRFLKFKLFFDAPVQMNGSTRVASAGNILTGGLWHHHEVRGQGYESMDKTHPDFIWLPTDFITNGRGGNANPFISIKNVKEMIKKGKVIEEEVALSEKVTIYLSNLRAGFNLQDARGVPHPLNAEWSRWVKGALKSIFNREGIKTNVFGARGIGPGQIEVGVEFGDETKIEQGFKLLKNSGFQVGYIEEPFGTRFYPTAGGSTPSTGGGSPAGGYYDYSGNWVSTGGGASTGGGYYDSSGNYVAGGGGTNYTGAPTQPQGCKAVAQQSGFNRNQSQRLCGQVQHGGPVWCANEALRAGLRHGGAIQLCRGSFSTMPVVCFRDAQQGLGLNRKQAKRLCEQARNGQRVRCVERISRRRPINQAIRRCLKKDGIISHRRARGRRRWHSRMNNYSRNIGRGGGTLAGADVGSRIGAAIADGQGGNTALGGVLGALGGAAIGAAVDHLANNHNNHNRNDRRRINNRNRRGRNRMNRRGGRGRARGARRAGRAMGRALRGVFGGR